MKIFNTLSKTKEEFKPIEKNKIKMYVCGPTVYNYFHLGNARPFLFFDVVRNYFKYKGFDVTYIQNITDIDDKIIAKANDENVDYKDITQKYIKAFFEDLKQLNIQKATLNPKATDYLPEMIALIQDLVNKGYAYESQGDVYFAVDKKKDYGKLSGKNLDDLQAGARIEANTQKHNPFDFTLWKKAKAGEPFWESPWGNGRPGWHTECVVMSKKHLGQSFDIHGGGIDLIFPHHENELAQAEAIDDKPLANFWLHNGFLNIEGDKMSKSLNNFFTTRDVLKKYNADTIRFFFLSKHYRSPIDYNQEILEESRIAINRFYEVFKKLPVYKENIINDHLSTDLTEIKNNFLAAMDDDFNTAKAIAYLFELSKICFNQNTEESHNIQAANLLYELGSVLGFFSKLKDELDNKIDDKAEKLITLLIEIRSLAKKQKNFEIADKIRNDLTQLDIELRDTIQGTNWSLKK
ncbi:MAG: cysteine--tRNA ligase [Candidatus Cloacimonetes bacterium]|nr:cysteine--tRNA ligase [Candidatus Cloacimonadota bacterium]